MSDAIKLNFVIIILSHRFVGWDSTLVVIYVAWVR